MAPHPRPCERASRRGHPGGGVRIRCLAPDLQIAPEPPDLDPDRPPAALPQPGERAGLRLVDEVLDDASLANVDARGGELRRVVLRRCRLTGLLLTEGRLRDVVIADSRVDLASFAACTLEQAVFEDCRLEGSSFQDARLRAVRFERCDLSEADLTGMRCERVELRGCTLDGVRGAEGLRGAALPWGDILAAAGTFASALGVRVLDTEA